MNMIMAIKGESVFSRLITVLTKQLKQRPGDATSRFATGKLAIALTVLRTTRRNRELPRCYLYDFLQTQAQEGQD